MTAFINVKEALRASNLQIYEKKFASQKFDDNTVLNCISDPDLRDQLKLIIPELADFVNFISKFKKLHRERSLIPETERCDKQSVVMADTEDGMEWEILGSQHEQMEATTIGAETNGCTIPLSSPTISDIIPLPPPMPTSEDSGSLKNSIPIARPPFLAELLQKKLTPIHSENPHNVPDQDDGYPPSIPPEDLEEDQKLIDLTTVVNSDLVNEIKRKNATRAVNGEDIARKIEENRLKRSNSVTSTINTSLNKILKRRTSVDIDAIIRSKNNSDSNNMQDFECPKPMVQLRKSEPRPVQPSEASTWQNEIQLKRTSQKTKNEGSVVSASKTDNIIADNNIPGKGISSADETRKPGPPLPVKPRKSTIPAPTPLPRPKILDKSKDKTILEIETSDKTGNQCSDTGEPPCADTTDMAQDTEPFQTSDISNLAHQTVLNSSPGMNTTGSTCAPQIAIVAPLSDSPIHIQNAILDSVQILTEIDSKPLPSCPLPLPPPPLPTQLSLPICANNRGKLMSAIRDGIELRKVGENSKTVRAREFNSTTSLPVNPLQSVLAEAMKNRRFDIEDTDSEDDQPKEDWEE